MALMVTTPLTVFSQTLTSLLISTLVDQSSYLTSSSGDTGDNSNFVYPNHSSWLFAHPHLVLSNLSLPLTNFLIANDPILSATWAKPWRFLRLPCFPYPHFICKFVGTSIKICIEYNFFSPIYYGHSSVNYHHLLY